ncbi:hypothetical protein JCM16303_000306 [Sporobolomyces ruberrimus]
MPPGIPLPTRNESLATYADQNFDMDAVCHSTLLSLTYEIPNNKDATVDLARSLLGSFLIDLGEQRPDFLPSLPPITKDSFDVRPNKTGSNQWPYVAYIRLPPVDPDTAATVLHYFLEFSNGIRPDDSTVGNRFEVAWAFSDGTRSDHHLSGRMTVVRSGTAFPEDAVLQKAISEALSKSNLFRSGLKSDSYVYGKRDVDGPMGETQVHPLCAPRSKLESDVCLLVCSQSMLVTFRSRRLLLEYLNKELDLKINSIKPVSFSLPDTVIEPKSPFELAFPLSQTGYSVYNFDREAQKWEEKTVHYTGGDSGISARFESIRRNTAVVFAFTTWTLASDFQRTFHFSQPNVSRETVPLSLFVVNNSQGLFTEDIVYNNRNKDTRERLQDIQRGGTKMAGEFKGQLESLTSEVRGLKNEVVETKSRVREIEERQDGMALALMQTCIVLKNQTVTLLTAATNRSTIREKQSELDDAKDQLDDFPADDSELSDNERLRKNRLVKKVKKLEDKIAELQRDVDESVANQERMIEEAQAMASRSKVTAPLALSAPAPAVTPSPELARPIPLGPLPPLPPLHAPPFPPPTALELEERQRSLPSTQRPDPPSPSSRFEEIPTSTAHIKRTPPPRVPSRGPDTPRFPDRLTPYVNPSPPWQPPASVTLPPLPNESTAPLPPTTSETKPVEPEDVEMGDPEALTDSGVISEPLALGETPVATIATKEATSEDVVDERDGVATQGSTTATDLSMDEGAEPLGVGSIDALASKPERAKAPRRSDGVGSSAREAAAPYPKPSHEPVGRRSGRNLAKAASSPSLGEEHARLAKSKAIVASRPTNAADRKEEEVTDVA